MTAQLGINLVIGALVVLPIFSWFTAIILTRLAIRKPYITSLTERAVSAVLKAIASTGIAVLGINAFAHFWTLERPWGTAIIVFCLLLLEFPAAIWLFLYYRDSFRGTDDVA